MELYQQQLSELTCSPHLEMMLLLVLIPIYVVIFYSYFLMSSSHLPRFFLDAPQSKFYVVAASFQSCAMSDTNSTLKNSVGTPFKAASFSHHRICALRPTDPSLLDEVGTFLEAASFLCCAMCDAHSSPNDSSGTPLYATSFLCCAMCGTDSPPSALA